MTNDMTTKLEFLRQQSLFQDLDEEDLEDLAALFEEFEYKEGAVVAYQRDAADMLYMVKSGRLYAKKVEQGIVTASRDFLPGDYFGLEWLFVPGIHGATIQAASRDDHPARLLILKSRPFLHYLSTHHDAVENLAPAYDATDTIVAGFPEEVYQHVVKVQAKRDRRSATMNILPDELVELITRRSGWFLFVRMLAPLILLLVVTVLPFNFLSNQPPGTFLYNIQLWCPGGLSVFFIGWAIFRFLDWTNDYFIVTNRRVIHREFNLRAFRVDIKVARIDQIQSVAVDKPTFISNMFNYGTVRITTASQHGVIYFDNINKPERVTVILEGLAKQVRVWDASREQTQVRQSIEEYFQFDQPYQRVQEGGETAAPPPEPPPGLWSRFLRRYQWRVEENGVITYHKHILVALRAIAVPLIVSGVIALVTYLVSQYEMVPVQLLFPSVGCVYFLMLIWIFWGIENWRNDLYQLDGRFIYDIDRLPLGFGESRKQAALQNIQNVKAYTPGIIHTIFNYGFVDVETAGVDSNIVFEHVPFPGVVQSDIFQQIEDFKRKQREAEEVRRHKAFAVLLDVYKQEEEQGRLPRRTPYPLSEEELTNEE
jgi:uncharacterized membrane protein YdbT with pleckstrin-like domain